MIHCRPEVKLIISTGCCGGLVPHLEPGTVSIAHTVLQLIDGAIIEAPAPKVEHAAKAQLIAAQLGLPCCSGPLLTVEHALCTPKEKQNFHQKSGALVVDMETAAIARGAAQHAIPYVSIRAVLDTAAEWLSPLEERPRGTGSSKPSPLRPEPDKILKRKELWQRFSQLSTNLIPILQGIIT
jgi:nucleoside phosphorylase